MKKLLINHTKTIFFSILFFILVIVGFPSNINFGFLNTVQASNGTTLSMGPRITINYGASITINVVNPPANADIVWDVKGDDIISATFNGLSCTVTGKKKGWGLVTARVNGTDYSCIVTVKSKAESKIQLSKTSKTIKTGKLFTLKLLNTDSSDSIWSTSSDVIKIKKS